MRRLATFTLSMYPLAFRRRYGDEMAALLEQSPVRSSTLLNLTRGAVGAHLHPANGPGAMLDDGERLRASTSAVLACWVVFAAAGFGFYKSTEDAPYSAAGRHHVLLGGAHLAVQVLAVVASCAVLAAALPLIVTALTRARRQPSLRLLVSLPAIAVLLYAALTALLVALARSLHSQPGSGGAHAAGVAWLLAGLACGAVCVVASRKVLFEIPVPEGRLTSALAFGTAVTTAMVLIAVATALYAIALQIDASRLAASPNGPLATPPTNLALAIQVVVMVIAGTMATVTTLRGWRAVHS